MNRARRRWHQFSLRALLVVTAVAAGSAAAWRVCVEPYRVQRQATVVIDQLGGIYRSDEATGWIRHWDKNAQDVIMVDLSNCDTPSEYLPHLGRLRKLEVLVVGGHEFDDGRLAVVATFPSLRGLVLDSTRVSDEAVERLKAAQPDVVVHKSQHRAIAAVEKFGAITRNNWEFDPEHGNSPPEVTVPPDWLLAAVGDTYFCVPPMRIDLDGKPVSDDDLAWLANLENTRDVSLEGTKVSDDGLANLAYLNDLQYLNVSNTRITDVGLGLIASLPRLRNLEARGTRVGNSGLATVAGMAAIVDLDVSDTLVTDEGLAHLERCKNLKTLWLQGTRITDEGLLHVQKLTGLADVFLHRTDITEIGRQRLEAALPKCATRH